jgi:uncharacterized protein YcbX
LVQKIEMLMLKETVFMFLVDTPVENYAAICFLKKHGYGEPIEQVYLCADFTSDGSAAAITSKTTSTITEKAADTALTTTTTTTTTTTEVVAPPTASTSSSELPASVPSAYVTALTPGSVQPNAPAPLTTTIVDTALQPPPLVVDATASASASASSTSSLTADYPAAALGKRTIDDTLPPGASSTDCQSKRQRSNVEIKIRQMTLDDVWSVFQIGEMVFTELRPNLYRFWDEVCH